MDNLQQKQSLILTKTNDPVLLSSLLKTTPDTIDLTITIPQNTTVTLVDDLEHSGTVEFFVFENAQLTYMLKVIDQATNIFQRRVITTLKGVHATASVSSLFHAKHVNKIRFKTIQKHEASHTTSSICVKGALDNRALLSCQSLVRIEKDIHNVHAEQLNKNLLLSKTARAIAVPTLEVLSKNVACHHGAAISNLDKNHLFYLESKGFSKQRARNILIDAFLHS